MYSLVQIPHTENVDRYDNLIIHINYVNLVILVIHTTYTITLSIRYNFVLRIMKTRNPP